MIIKNAKVAKFRNQIFSQWHRKIFAEDIFNPQSFL
jgi:hypothetical protein